MLNNPLHTLEFLNAVYADGLKSGGGLVVYAGYTTAIGPFNNVELAVGAMNSGTGDWHVGVGLLRRAWTGQGKHKGDDVGWLPGLFCDLDARDSELWPEYNGAAAPIKLLYDRLKKADALTAAERQEYLELTAEGKKRALARIAGFTLKPTVLWETGAGYQFCYVFPEPLNTIAGDETDKALTHRLRDAGQKIGGDTVYDLARIMRVPGSEYRKKSAGPLSGAPITLIHCNADERHTLDNIVSAFSFDQALTAATLAAEVEEAAAPPPRQGRMELTARNFSDGPPPIEKVRDALSHLSAARAADYAEWVKVGLALKNTYGDEALPLFHEFSQRCSDKYNAEDVGKKWEKIKPAGTLSARSIWHWARQDSPGFDHARRAIAEAHDKTGAWEEPLPLELVAEPSPYPLDALPEVIRSAVAEVQAYVQAPDALVAASALGAAALAVQGRFDVRRDPRLVGPTSLFMLTIGESGERKSTCDGYFTTAIREHEENERAKMAGELAEYAAALSAWEAKRAGILEAIKRASKDMTPTDEHAEALRQHEDAKPCQPKVPRTLYHDATAEALLGGLSMWPEAGMISSEGGGIFGAHGMKRENIMRYLSILNRLWDGFVDPVDRSQAKSIPGGQARFTVGIMAQSATMLDFMAGSRKLAKGCGFMARFLIAVPDSKLGDRPYVAPPDTWPALHRFNEALRTVLQLSLRFDEAGRIKPDCMELSPAAKAVWVEYHDSIEAELRPEGDYATVADAGAKSADQAARIAAIFQALEDPFQFQVSAENMQRATILARWHLDETRRFMGDVATDPDLKAAAKLEAWLILQARKEGELFISRRDALRLVSSSSLRNLEKMDRAVDTLQRHGRARYADHAGKKCIELNPAILES